MSKSAMIRARVEPDLKERAESTLEKLGLSPTAAITLFYRQIVQRRGLPFEVRIPNAVTRRAMRDAESGLNLIEAESMDELFAKLNDDDEPSARPRKGRAKTAR
jgi:DNA-damage-inducible protein J